MFDVACKFHVAADSPLRDAGHALESLRPYAAWLGQHDPAMRHWYLGGDSVEESLAYEAFAEGVNKHPAVLAILRNQYKQSRAPVVFLWNGHDDKKTGASLSLGITERMYPSSIDLELDGSAAEPRAEWSDYRTVAELVALLARGTRAECCTVYRKTAYGRRMTFPDRPGVGWMLYLPRVFTPAELPEARALVPVELDRQRIGTIIVSVTDGVFNVRNDEHLRIARDIEARLVSNDWLPTWAQMMQR